MLRCKRVVKKQEIGESKSKLHVVQNAASNYSYAMKIKRKSQSFFVEEGQLFQKVNQGPLRCLTGDKVIRVLKKVHVGVCGEHQGHFRLFNIDH